MDAVLFLVYLIAFVLSVIMIVAQFQLFAIRRLLERLVELTTPHTVTATPPAPEIVSPRQSIAAPPTAAEVYKPNWTMIIIAAIIVVVALVAFIAFLGSGPPR